MINVFFRPALFNQTLKIASHHDREDRIARAIKTSFVSKGTTLLFQFIVMPLVARRLGPEMFGFFALMSAIPGFFSAMDLGIGPALGHKIAVGVAASDRAIQARYFRAAFLFVTVAAAAILAIGSAALLSGKADLLFGRNFALHGDLLERGFWIVLVIVALQMIASLGFKTRTGFQEIHINNIFGTLGNLATVVSLALVVWLRPTLVWMLFAVYGVVLLFHLCNVGHLVYRRPYLLVAHPRDRIWSDIRALLANSLLYAVAIGLLGWQRELSKLLLGRVAGPVEVGQLTILLSIMSMLGGLVTMVTMPVWPAIADARARGDDKWVESLWSQINRLSMAYGLLAAVAVGLGGQYFVKTLYGSAYEIPTACFWLLGAYFLTQVLSHIRFTWLLGYNRVGQLAFAAVLEFAVIAICLAFCYRHLTIAILLIILLINHLLFAVILQEILRTKALKENPRNVT